MQLSCLTVFLNYNFNSRTFHSFCFCPGKNITCTEESIRIYKKSYRNKMCNATSKKKAYYSNYPIQVFFLHCQQPPRRAVPEASPSPKLKGHLGRPRCLPSCKPIRRVPEEQLIPGLIVSLITVLKLMLSCRKSTYIATWFPWLPNRSR